MSFEREMMQRCLKLALKARGKTSPNPMVGAIIVRGGEVVGEGFHPGAGKPHAEVFALQEAREAARGATMYVNLEPCNHYGRTPPCTEAIIKAGIAKVVVGIIDPYEGVAGRGVSRLREAGIEVVVGIEAEACQQLNEGFIHRVTHRRPLGILKYAMTLDGKIATTTGHSAWVTGEPARSYVHHLRAGCDAVIVGGNTVRKDNPHLTTHGASERNPLRVVMSYTLDFADDCHLWRADVAPTAVFTQRGGSPASIARLSNRGVEVVELPSLTPTAVMENLYERDCCQVLWECGGKLAAAAIASGSVQKVLAFIAPKIVGGEDAPSPVADLGIVNMAGALRLEKTKFTHFDGDLLVEGYLMTGT